jgi:hypothetical protein
LKKIPNSSSARYEREVFAKGKLFEALFQGKNIGIQNKFVFGIFGELVLLQIIERLNGSKTVNFQKMFLSFQIFFLFLYEEKKSFRGMCPK